MVCRAGRTPFRTNNRDSRPAKERVTNDQKSNEAFEKYYKSIIPAEEWDSFYEHCKKELPFTFRITGPLHEANKLPEIFKAQFEESFVNIPDEDVVKPINTKWFPRELSYRIPIEQLTMRKDPKYAALRQWLISNHNVGNINRQEEVSMIPPVFLSPEPSDVVLDMCAAPGSKTQQLVDYISSTEDEVKGVVIANDLDLNRCRMLCHNVGRLSSPSLIVTNCDASRYPDIVLGENEVMKFDKILLDVVCSGDGTIRKAPDLWTRWTPNKSISLHALQFKIFQRAAQMLKVGGRMVYSTCSMSPIENEAVVAALLKWSNGNMRVVDVSKEHTELKRAAGMTEWKVYNSNKDVFYSTLDEACNDNFTSVAESMFSTDISDEIRAQLPHCMRFYPHLQNTGGFFVVVLEKTGEVEEPAEEPCPTPQAFALAESENAKINALRSHFRKYKDCFFTNAATSPRLEEALKEFHLTGEVDKKNFFARAGDKETDFKNLYIMTEAASKILNPTGIHPYLQQAKLSVINAGIGAFTYNAIWRLPHQAIDILAPQLKKTDIVYKELSEEHMKELIKKDMNFSMLRELSEALVSWVESVPAPGYCFIQCNIEDPFIKGSLLPFYVGKDSLSLHVKKEVRESYITRFCGGEDTA